MKMKKLNDIRIIQCLPSPCWTCTIPTVILHTLFFNIARDPSDSKFLLRPSGNRRSTPFVVATLHLRIPDLSHCLNHLPVYRWAYLFSILLSQAYFKKFGVNVREILTEEYYLPTSQREMPQIAIATNRACRNTTIFGHELYRHKLMTRFWSVLLIWA